MQFFGILLVLWVSFLVLQCDAFKSITSCKRNFLLSSDMIGKPVKTPSSIADMMKEAAESVSAAFQDKISVALVDFPIPVTGGTELDDWPGGIKQKYSVLRPLLIEMMKRLNFTAEVYGSRSYLGSDGEDDAVGFWASSDYSICCFPTADSIPLLSKLQSPKNIVVIVNQQFFLDTMSKAESKDYLESATIAYRLEQLSMRGPGALPVRGILYRKYPGPFLAGRRLDRGGYVTLQTFENKPSRDELETLFFEDSKIRDKNLSMMERLRRQVPNF